MAYFFTVLAELVRSGPSNVECGMRAQRAPLAGNAERAVRPAPPNAEAGSAKSERTERQVPPVEVPPPPPPTALNDATTPVAGLLPRSEFRAPTSAYSPYIAGVMLDYGRELGADRAGTGHVTQALRLWAQSGLGETPFVGLLHAASRQVRSSTLPSGARLNSMPQFFTVVQTLLAGAPTTPAQGGS